MVGIRPFRDQCSKSAVGRHWTGSAKPTIFMVAGVKCLKSDLKCCRSGFCVFPVYSIYSDRVNGSVF